MTYKDHASVSYVQFKGQKLIDGDMMKYTQSTNKYTIPCSHFMAMPTSVGHMRFNRPEYLNKHVCIESDKVATKCLSRI